MVIPDYAGKEGYLSDTGLHVFAHTAGSVKLKRDNLTIKSISGAVTLTARDEESGKAKSVAVKITSCSGPRSSIPKPLGEPALKITRGCYRARAGDAAVTAYGRAGVEGSNWSPANRVVIERTGEAIVTYADGTKAAQPLPRSVITTIVDTANYGKPAPGRILWETGAAKVVTKGEVREVSLSEKHVASELLPSGQKKPWVTQTKTTKCSPFREQSSAKRA